MEIRVNPKGADDAITGRARDVSLGGVFVETGSPLPFGTEVIVRLLMPGHKEELAMPAVVRWTGSDGMGLQWRLLGARETHAITEVVRASGRAGGAR